MRAVISGSYFLRARGRSVAEHALGSVGLYPGCAKRWPVKVKVGTSRPRVHANLRGYNLGNVSGTVKLGGGEATGVLDGGMGGWQGGYGGLSHSERKPLKATDNLLHFPFYIPLSFLLVS